MSQRLYTNEIADHWIGLINTNIATSLGLELVQKGRLESYPNIATIGDYCPAIFICPKDISTSNTDTSVNLFINYNFDVVYLIEESTANLEETLMLAVNTICELIIDNIDMPGYSESNMQVISCLPTIIDYHNTDYNTILEDLTVDLRAVLINLKVETIVRR